MPENSPHVHAKALAVNLDKSSYGTLAEIGAGQEVARYFLTVGGASGTVAQTISAYDKTFSDTTYGAGSRYVSRERVLAMLDHEYKLLVERLGPVRGADTRFFVFADTAAARNFHGDNHQHAWVGLRFQRSPGAEPSDILLHVELLDPTAPLQQQALGVLGVNLIYAAFFRLDAGPDEFLSAVWDELGIDRLEVDVVDFRGPAAESVDARGVCLTLIRRGMARAIVFDVTGRSVEPASVLRKRPLVVERGLFDRVEPHHEAVLRAAEQRLREEGAGGAGEPVGLLELSLDPLTGTPPGDADVLARVGQLTRLGPVVVSGFAEGHRLADYLRRHTPEPIRFAVGVSHLARLLEERFYRGEAGQLLEGLGKLFARNVKVFAYPMPRAAVVDALGPSADQFRIDGTGDELVAAAGIHPRPPIDHLYSYLLDAGWILPVAPG